MKGGLWVFILVCAYPSVTHSGYNGNSGNWPTIYGWEYYKPVEVRITFDGTEDTPDPNGPSCYDYLQQFYVLYDFGLPVMPTYKVLPFRSGIDYPDLMKAYQGDFVNFIAIRAPPGQTCVELGRMCTRKQQIVSHPHYFGSVVIRNQEKRGTHSSTHDLKSQGVSSIYYGDGAISTWNKHFPANPPAYACNICAVTGCAEHTCPNGKYHKSPPLRTIDEKIMDRTECVACPVGTWLTCSSADMDVGCSYIAPTDKQWQTQNTTGKTQWISKNRYATPPSDISMGLSADWSMLVDKCYPCTLARNRLHYGVLITSSDELFNQGFLSFTCPGGALPPLACPPHEMSRFDPVTKAATTCDCMHGYYRKDGVCAPCEAGNYCVFGAGKVRCADDHYSLAGSSTCTPCARNVNICPENEALTRCITGFQDKDSYCVDCGTCQQLWSGATAVPCYRLSSVGT